MISTRVLAASCLGIALGLIGMAGASAHGGNAALIHSCVHQNNGNIRIVGANDNCQNNEAALDWNQQGIQGPAGQSGISGYEIVSFIQNGALPAFGDVDAMATCSAGKKVLGGGYVVSSVLDTAPLSRPEGDNAWKVSFHSNGGSGAVSVYAICAFVD